MTNTHNYLRLTTGFLTGTGIAILLALSFAIPQAKADTNILTGTNLTVGSTEQNVVVLQGLLSEMGYLNIPFNIPLGYFGSLTKSALAKYQVSQNIYPPVGYFGPLTKIAMHQQFSSNGWLAILGW